MCYVVECCGGSAADSICPVCFVVVCYVDTASVWSVYCVKMLLWCTANDFSVYCISSMNTVPSPSAAAAGRCARRRLFGAR